MCDSLMTPKTQRGFSLIEMLVAGSIILILAALAIPSLLTYVYAVRIRYSASDLSGLLQNARMESVRRNSFYSLQQANQNNTAIEQVVDKNGNVVTTIAPAVMASNVNIFFARGAGLPRKARC